VKWGVELRDMLNNRRSIPAFISLSFSAGFTQANPQAGDSASGDAFASFLMGYPSSVSSNITPALAYGQHYYMGFVQDDWRISSKVTLNLGLRWDYEAPITERYNRMVIGFDPTGSSTIGGIAVKGGIKFASPSDRVAYNKDLNNWQPRIGIAYRSSNKLVFRGGWGITYQSGSADTPGATGFDLSTSPTTSGGAGYTPLTTAGCTGGNCGMLSNPFPTGLNQPYGSSRGLLTNAGSSVSYYNRNRVIPYMQTFSAGFQYELPWRTVADISYSGSRSRQMATSYNMNSVSYGQYLKYGQATTTDAACGGTAICTLATTVPNPFYPNLAGTSLSTTTMSLQQSLLPYPQFTGVTQNGINLGTSRYDSLQIRLEKRVSHGFSALFTTTLSRNTSHNSYQNNGMDAIGQFIDRYDGAAPDQFNIILTYQVPAFAKAGALVRTVLGGWTVAGSATYYEGGMISISGAIPTGVDPWKNKTTGKEFNTCTYNQQTNARQNCTDANQQVAWIYQKTYTLNMYPSKQWYRWRSPMVIQNNLSLNKAFKIRESLRFELRGEAFNASNTPLKPWANTTVTAATFGTIVYPRSQSNDPRSVQLSAKLAF
jgi:hypothetical protein